MWSNRTGDSGKIGEDSLGTYPKEDDEFHGAKGLHGCWPKEYHVPKDIDLSHDDSAVC